MNNSEKLRVVVNHEEQYSFWPAQKEIPAGWRDTGVSGTLEECRAYVNETWVDMRPLSLRPKTGQDVAA